MKTVLKYGILMLTVAVVLSCKKYEEGGFYMYSKRNLLSHDGKWSLDAFIVDGIDSTKEMFQPFDEEIKKNFITITYYSDLFYIRLNNQYRENDYFFQIDKDELNIKRSTINGIYPLLDSISPGNFVRPILTPNRVSTNWKIRELTRKRIALTSLDNKFELRLIANK